MSKKVKFSGQHLVRLINKIYIYLYITFGKRKILLLILLLFRDFFTSAARVCYSLVFPSKILEHIIFYHVMEHVDNYKLLKDYQHGLRQTHSCESQLLTTIEGIASTLNYSRKIHSSNFRFFKGMRHRSTSAPPL